MRRFFFSLFSHILARHSSALTAAFQSCCQCESVTVAAGRQTMVFFVFCFFFTIGLLSSLQRGAFISHKTGGLLPAPVFKANKSCVGQANTTETHSDSGEHCAFLSA